MNINYSKILATLMFLLFASGCFAGALIDSRDGNTYRTVKIGDQEWMADNLNYYTSESKCYQNREGFCKKYGRLYMGEYARSVCPKGWHLPSKEEFEILLKAAGGRQDPESEWGSCSSEWYKASVPLRSKTGWADIDGKKGNGTDVLGFAAKPAGGYFISDCDDDCDGDSGDGFFNEGKAAGFWSSTEGDNYNGNYLYLNSDYRSAFIDYGREDQLFSVRCIKDE